jgi:hypothetical protein
VESMIGESSLLLLDKRCQGVEPRLVKVGNMDGLPHCCMNSFLRPLGTCRIRGSARSSSLGPQINNCWPRLRSVRQ